MSEDQRAMVAAKIANLDLRRRHLNEGQRASVAGKIANMQGGRPKENTANLQSFLPAEPAAHQVSVARAAEMLNVSERSVKNARVVISRAGTSGKFASCVMLVR